LTVGEKKKPTDFGFNYQENKTLKALIERTSTTLATHIFENINCNF
jgi:hypothetical protein